MWNPLTALLIGAALCWANALPDPRIVAHHELFGVNEWSPAPTAAPNFELFKRQVPDAYRTCGYISGDPSQSLTCPVGAICGLNTVSGWFGCCPSATLIGTVFEPLGCPVVTYCADYTALDKCAADVNCASNTAVLKCVDTASPYCVGFALLNYKTVTDYACGPTAFLAGVWETTTGPGGAVPTLSSVLGGSGNTPTFLLSTTASEPSNSLPMPSSTRTAPSVVTTSVTVKSSSAHVAATGAPALIEFVGAAAVMVFNLV